MTTATLDANGNSVARDLAPDGERWLFDLAGPHQKLVSFLVPVIGKPVQHWQAGNATAGLQADPRLVRQQPGGIAGCGAMARPTGRNSGLLSMAIG